MLLFIKDALGVVAYHWASPLRERHVTEWCDADSLITRFIAHGKLAEESDGIYGGVCAAVEDEITTTNPMGLRRKTHRRRQFMALSCRPE
jgi:hypothetical protein